MFYVIIIKTDKRIFFMKTVSTMIIVILLQSSSPLAQKIRYFFQKRLISHF